MISRTDATSLREHACADFPTEFAGTGVLRSFGTTQPGVRELNYRDSSLTCAAPGPSSVRRAAKGTIIYRQNDPAAFRFEVVSGVVRTSYLFMDGRRQLTGFFFAGEAFGVEQGLYRTSAEVVSDGAEFRRFSWGDHDEDERALNQALELIENSILLLGRRTALSRMAAFLLDVRARTGEGGCIHLPMSQADMADFLGLTVETVSRSFSQLVRQRLITRLETHLVRFLDLGRLGALAGTEFEEA
jgi:CRP-like cAMP-binding protein